MHGLADKPVIGISSSCVAMIIHNMMSSPQFPLGKKCWERDISDHFNRLSPLQVYCVFTEKHLPNTFYVCERHISGFNELIA